MGCVHLASMPEAPGLLVSSFAPSPPLLPALKSIVSSFPRPSKTIPRGPLQPLREDASWRSGNGQDSSPYARKASNGPVLTSRRLIEFGRSLSRARPARGAPSASSSPPRQVTRSKRGPAGVPTFPPEGPHTEPRPSSIPGESPQQRAAPRSGV